MRCRCRDTGDRGVLTRLFDSSQVCVCVCVCMRVCVCGGGVEHWEQEVKSDHDAIRAMFRCSLLTLSSAAAVYSPSV